jgi:surface protein
MRKEKGLTLIALIVTIIVMIILAGIAISAITGKSGITNQARESKNKSERQEIIESAKSQISDTLVENVGTDITRSQLKEILDKYFENVPDDYTLDTELTTKSGYGNYVIKVSEIYDRTTIFADNGEDSSETTPANTSSTNGGSGSNSTGNNTGSTSLSTKNSESTGEEQNNSTREPEEIDVTGVKLDNKSVILDLNGKNTIQLNATPIPNNANKNTKMKWTSKKKTVATVTQDGMVTGKAVGNSTIMAASKNGKSAECLVVCQAKITGITVNPVTASIPVGGTIQLTATIAPNTVTEKITWKSSNTDVAKVNRNGLVTGVAKGKAIITAQNPAGTIKATCTVTVGNATLMVASSGTGKDTANYLRSNVVKNKIESIKFVKGQVPTAGIIEQFDASEAEDSSIIGYYTDEDSNDMYELTFVSEKNIEANQNSSYLFYYLSNVKEIAFDNFDTSQVTNMGSMFEACKSLTSLDVSKFDTSQVTDMSYMFGEGEALETLDVSKLNTNQVINMDGMFHHCKNLISLDVSEFDTSHVTDMSGMFNHCENLTSLDVSKFDTSQVKSMRWMFGNCESLTNLDVRKFDTSQVTNMKAMFQACRKLIELNISNFNTSQVTNMSYMFCNCSSLRSIYVSEYNETTGNGWTTKNVTDSDEMFTSATKLVGGNGTKFNSSYIDATYARIDKEGEPGYLTNIDQKASETESYVGYYADVDGDGTVDGIIFADLLHGKTGQWGDSNGTYTIPTIESTKVKSYKISQEDYTDPLGGTSKILTTSGDGNDRFYVMDLTNVGTSEYRLANSQMSGTITTFGSGKANTQTLRETNNLYFTLREPIESKVNKGWFIPSKEEWSAFGEELGITRSNYSAKGLSREYWSSSQNDTDLSCAWYADFDFACMEYMNGNNGDDYDYNYVRMATTF